MELMTRLPKITPNQCVTETLHTDTGIVTNDPSTKQCDIASFMYAILFKQDIAVMRPVWMESYHTELA